MKILKIIFLSVLFVGIFSLFIYQEEKIEKINKVRIIINPQSGTNNKKNIEKLISQHLNKTFDAEIIYTKGPKHATFLSAQAASKGYKLVIAVGGDGTINEVGKGLISSNTIMGIIPAGSGNGLAKHLNIPTNPIKAIQVINKLQYTSIDTIQINQEHFLGIAGIGFDAHIAWKFAKSKKRGLLTYSAITLKDYHHYKPQAIDMIIDGKPVKKKGLLISFANSSQYGNDIKIAPKANLKDGHLDLVILKPPPFYALFDVFMKLKEGKIIKSKYYESIPCKEINIQKNKLLAHIDGEPRCFNGNVSIKVHPSSLKVLN